MELGENMNNLNLIREYVKLVLIEGKKKGLWDNVHAKRKRGEKPAKKGDKGYPDEKSWKAAQESDDLDEADSIDKDRMKCNKPRYLKKGEPGYGNKQKVVKACDPDSDKEKLQKFGDAKMRNNRDKPGNKKSFRARHNCPDKNMEKDWDTASYWACKDW
jgi:hypothetical protein